MSIRFKANWPADIAAISERPEFMTATLEIRNPLLVTSDIDVRTGTATTNGNPVVARGRGRVIGTRAVTEATDGTVSDPTNIKPIRIQIPRDMYDGRIIRGWQIRVVDGGRNPRLESMVFVVRSDVQGGNMASRTVECAVDVEAYANWIDYALESIYPGPNLFPSNSLYPV